MSFHDLGAAPATTLDCRNNWPSGVAYLPVRGPYPAASPQWCGPTTSSRSQRSPGP